jgi:hypothetical protein
MTENGTRVYPASVTVEEWMLDIGLGNSEVLVFALVYGYARSGREYYESLKHTTRWAMCGPRTAMLALASLAERGYLDERKEGQGAAAHYFYTVSAAYRFFVEAGYSGPVQQDRDTAAAEQPAPMGRDNTRTDGKAAEKQTFSRKEAARFLGLHIHTLDSSGIPRVRVGGRILYRRETLEKVLEEGERKCKNRRKG